jgi:hypothetical protein
VCSAVNLDADLDVVLCVPARALLAAFRDRLGPGYATAIPDTIQWRFLETPGIIINGNDTITVILNRRAYSPVLRRAAAGPELTGMT